MMMKCTKLTITIFLFSFDMLKIKDKVKLLLQQKKIADLKLSTGAKNALKDGKFATAFDIYERQEELNKIRGLGPKGIAAIIILFKKDFDIDLPKTIKKSYFYIQQ